MEDVEKIKGAEDALKRVSELLAKITHEMRTPLASILGYAEMMYDAKQTVANRLHGIGRIRKCIKNLTVLVDAISDLSVVEAGEIEVCPREVALFEELSNIFSELHGQAWKKRIAFEVHYDGSLPASIKTDAKRLRQILSNVIGNAIQFTERGEVRVTVRLDSSGKAPELQFVVHDTGGGIAPPLQKGIFDPLFSHEQFLSSKNEGCGLGLFLSKRFAMALGGDVILKESNPKHGSTFAVTINPGSLEGVILSKVEPRIDVDHVSVTPGPFSSERRVDGMRVLLVEDASDIQMLISQFLKKNGATVDIAKDGVEGIKKAREGRYDLILMDIQMPFLNGYEVASQLHHQGFRTPIVALTAHAMRGVKEKCLEAGCDDYLTKPINAPALLELMCRYYRRVGASNH